MRQVGYLQGMQVRISQYAGTAFGGWYVDKVTYMYVTWRGNT